MIIVDSFSVLYLTQTNKDFYHSISNLLHMDSGVSIAINYKEEDLSQKGTLTNKQTVGRFLFASHHVSFVVQEPVCQVVHTALLLLSLVRPGRLGEKCAVVGAKEIRHGRHVSHN